MPQCKIIENSYTDQGSIKASETFTGDVYMQRIHQGDGVMVANVNFLPGGRTFWHHHENGQILRVLAGSGWVCDKGSTPKRLKVGDVCVCPPDTTHWHGADENSYMVHQAVSLGKTSWFEEVSQQEFAKKDQTSA